MIKPKAMPIDLTRFDADAAAMIADLPANATFLGQVFPGILTDISKNERLNMNGALEVIDAQFSFRIAAITNSAQMAEGARIAITAPAQTAAVNYKIATVSREADGNVITLTLSSDRRN
jgi:hypothetical protein